jgi:hypothetical protein
VKESKIVGEMVEESKKNLYMDSFDKIKRNPELKEMICWRLAKARV